MSMDRLKASLADRYRIERELVRRPRVSALTPDATRRTVMGYRVFTDKQGHQWEVRDRTRSEWEFIPTSGNPEKPRTLPPPGYESDPFELSEEELQRMVDDPRGEGRSRPKKSPFGD